MTAETPLRYRTPRLLISAVYLVLSSVALLVTGLPDAHGQAANNVTYSPCHIDGIEALSRCATLDVPFDWSDPNGDTFALFVAVVPPSGGQPTAAPLYLLAGGPGQAASDQGALVQTVLSKARRGREVVLVDQRGTGRSAPFNCSLPDNPNASGDTAARQCLAQTSNDPRLFHSDAFIDDLHAVRNALGHDKINLWGGSYGTRAALLYLRKYEHTVRSVILDAVAAPNTPFLARAKVSAGDALNRFLTACEQAEDCRAGFPDLRADLQQVVNSLNAEPQSLALNNQSLTVDASVFLNVLRNAMYARESTAWLPFVINEFARGNARPWQALGDAGGALTESISLGTMLSVLCAEEVPHSTGDDLLSSTTVFNLVDVTFWDQACGVWPTASIPDNYNADVISAVPTLLLSGALDPITPPAYGDIAARTLSRSRHLVAQHNGHITSGYGCAPTLISEFLDHTDPDALDAECLNRIDQAPFLLDLAGPKP